MGPGPAKDLYIRSHVKTLTMPKHQPSQNIDRNAKTLICNDFISSLSPTETNTRRVSKTSSLSKNDITLQIKMTGDPEFPAINEFSRRRRVNWRQNQCSPRQSHGGRSQIRTQPLDPRVYWSSIQRKCTGNVVKYYWETYTHRTEANIHSYKELISYTGNNNVLIFICNLLNTYFQNFSPIFRDYTLIQSINFL